MTGANQTRKTNPIINTTKVWVVLWALLQVAAQRCAPEQVSCRRRVLRTSLYEHFLEISSVNCLIIALFMEISYIYVFFCRFLHWAGVMLKKGLRNFIIWAFAIIGLFSCDFPKRFVNYKYVHYNFLIEQVQFETSLYDILLLYIIGWISWDFLR